MEQTKVHISQIVVGDTILCSDGKMRTVCKKDIDDTDTFMGRSLFGDTYKLGYTKVIRIDFIVPTNKGYRRA